MTSQGRQRVIDSRLVKLAGSCSSNAIEFRTHCVPHSLSRIKRRYGLVGPSIITRLGLLNDY